MASLDLEIAHFIYGPIGGSRPTTRYYISKFVSTLKSKFKRKKTAYRCCEAANFSDVKIFLVLRDFLQPDTTLSLESVVESIASFLPKNAPLSNEIWLFGELCFDLAKHIPYHHPSQLKLARVLEYLGKSGCVTERHTPKGKPEVYHRYQRFGESMRDNYNDPDPRNPKSFVNYHTFVANLYELHVFPTDPTYAVWALRDAFETTPRAGDSIHEKDDSSIQEKYDISIHEAFILAGAQWILWYGQALFKQILFIGHVSSEDRRGWAPGDLYIGKGTLSLHRWHFWRDGFRATTSDASGAFSEECKSVAKKAADMMDAIESSLSF